MVSCAEALTVAKAAGLELGNAYEAIRISSGNSFVHETESQVILNGSRDISFTMDLVAKDIGLFQAVADRVSVPLDVSPLLIEIFQDGINKFGSRELSPNIIKRLEEVTGLSNTAQVFPPQMVDDEPEEPAYEVQLKKFKTNKKTIRTLLSIFSNFIKKSVSFPNFLTDISPRFI